MESPGEGRLILGCLKTLSVARERWNVAAGMRCGVTRSAIVRPASWHGVGTDGAKGMLRLIFAIYVSFLGRFSVFVATSLACDGEKGGFAVGEREFLPLASVAMRLLFLPLLHHSIR